MTDNTFGAFIRLKRLEKMISLRRFAEMLDLSPVHMSNLENNKRPAPKKDILERIALILQLDKASAEEMYDLAAKSKTAPTVSSDLPEYIMENDIVRIALRTAKDVDATDKSWEEFIEKLLEQDSSDKK